VSSPSNILVNVIIVTFNQKNFVSECIDSVLDQDYENLKIIVSDDCSTDGTVEIIEKYSRKYEKKIVPLFSNKNYGLTKNISKASKLCEGKYISHLGGDDLMLEGKISTQVEFMERNSTCSICYHDVLAFDSGTNEDLYRFSSKYKPRDGGVKTMIRHGSFNCGSTNMFRAKSLPLLGFDERVPIASDWLYCVESLVGGGQINYIDKVLVRYRRHSKNITSSSESNKARANLAQEDHFTSCAILSARFPGYYLSIRYRLSSLFFSMAVSNKKSYLRFLLISFVHFPTRNNLGAILLYLFTSKKI
jgi:glycosyltransferase involved in cell wall biosynthesis